MGHIYNTRRPGLCDDIASFSHSHQHIQDKTNRLNKYAESIGLKIST